MRCVLVCASPLELFTELSTHCNLVRQLPHHKKTNVCITTKCKYTKTKIEKSLHIHAEKLSNKMIANSELAMALPIYKEEGLLILAQ